MLIKRPDDVRASEITPKAVFFGRRKLLLGAAAGAASALLLPDFLGRARVAHAGGALGPLKKSPLSASEALTPRKDILSYNNFYELGTSKDEPAKLAHRMHLRPWTVRVEGACGKPKTWDIDELIKAFPLEERIYRHRCVETWSAVVPWVGIPLADVIKRYEPTSRAKYVEFVTLYDLKQMSGQRDPILQWPYVEGLRMDEAMNPLAILAVGLYGEVLPNQDGAPIRLVVPWKYGFKSGKSIVKISFVEKQPLNTWQESAPGEYGFYSNVNPQRDHPRWSQATERRIGEVLMRKTLMFNGYGDQVASLYAGMNLQKNY